MWVSEIGTEVAVVVRFGFWLGGDISSWSLLSTPTRGPSSMLPEPRAHSSDIPNPLAVLRRWGHRLPALRAFLLVFWIPRATSICSAYAHLMNAWINELLRQYRMKLIVLTSRHSPIVLHLRKLFFVYLNSWFCCVPISIAGTSYKAIESILMGQSLYEITLYMFISNMI